MPDERVQAAIKNWAPRFIPQGVDYNDFFRTTARIERWDDWCREWCLTGELRAELATRAQEKGNSVSAGQAWVAAALAYHLAKFLFQDHPDEYKEAAQDSIDAYARGLALLEPSAERIEIPFEGAAMVGILRKPQGLERPPLVVLLPGLDSTKEEFFYWIVPWEQGQKIVNAIGGNAEFALFENGNHVCDNIPYIFRPLTADWLKEKLR